MFKIGRAKKNSRRAALLDDRIMKKRRELFPQPLKTVQNPLQYRYFLLLLYTLKIKQKYRLGQAQTKIAPP